MHNWLKIACVSALYLSSLPVFADDIQDVSLYVYHDQPPLITGFGEGLSYSLANGLNASQEKFSFKVTLRPRSRLNAEIAPWTQSACGVSPEGYCPQNKWAVLWVCPSWGWGENAEQLFSWVDLMPAQNVIISHRQNMVEYSSPQSLAGMRLAAISGHYMPGIDALVKQGRIRRMDGSNYQSLIWRVLQQRADASMLMNTALEYYLREEPELAARRDEIYISGKPFQVMMLQAMLPVADNDIAEVINQFTHSQVWLDILKTYQLDTQPLEVGTPSLEASACKVLTEDD